MTNRPRQERADPKQGQLPSADGDVNQLLPCSLALGNNAEVLSLFDVREWLGDLPLIEVAFDGSNQVSGEPVCRPSRMSCFRKARDSSQCCEDQAIPCGHCPM